jgi:hypothetical protein
VDPNGAAPDRRAARRRCLAWAEALAGRGEAERASEQAEWALHPAQKYAFAAIEARALALVSATPAASLATLDRPDD